VNAIDNVPSGMTKRTGVTIQAYPKVERSRNGGVKPDSRRLINGTFLKWCNSGKHWVPASEFGFSKDRIDRLYIQCKACVRSCNSMHLRKKGIKKRIFGTDRKIIDGVESKHCSKDHWSDVKNFGVSKSTNDGLSGICKECVNRYTIDRARKKGVKPARRVTERKIVDGVECKYCPPGKHWVPLDQFCKNSRFEDGVQRSCKQCVRKRNFEIKYGIPWDTKVEMHRNQDGKCANRGCRRELSPEFSDTDHCHKTGIIRALLCQGCNTSLGSLGECPDRIRGLADYIESFIPAPYIGSVKPDFDFFLSRNV
jgi:Recombination endonuclease VII